MHQLYCPACRTHNPADERHSCSGLEEMRRANEHRKTCPHTFATQVPGKEEWHCTDCDYLGPRPTAARQHR